MKINTVKLSARHSLPNYEHVIAEMEFSLDAEENLVYCGADMSAQLAKAIQIAIDGLKGNPAPAPIAPKVAPAQASKAEVKTTVPIKEVVEKIVEKAAPKVEQKPGDQMARRIGYVRKELAQHEVPEAVFLTHHKAARLEDIPSFQTAILAQHIVDMVKAVAASMGSATDDDIPM